MLSFGWSLLVACNETPPSAPPVEPPRPAALQPDAAVAPSGAPSASASAGERPGLAVTEAPALRRRMLLATRPLARQRLAFTRHRLAQLTTEELVVRSRRDLRVLTRIPLGRATHVLGLPSASIVALGHDDVLRLSAAHLQAERFSRWVLLGPAEITPDPRDVRRFYLRHQGERGLSHYLLEKGHSDVNLAYASVDLPGFDGRALTVLAGGAFCYTTETGLAVQTPGGRRRERSLPEGVAGVERLLPARGQEEVWVLDGASVAHLLRPVGAAAPTARREFGGTVFDVVSAGEWIAAVVVDQAVGTEKRWRAVVLDGLGEQRLGAPLAPGADDGPGWIERQTRDRALALARDHTQLAVGGDTMLRVWRLRSRAELEVPALPTPAAEPAAP